MPFLDAGGTMSIASMAEDSALRLGQPQTEVAATPLSQLVKYIPTETVTLYVAVVAAIGEPEIPEGGTIADADFTTLWWATGIMLVLTVLLSVGLSFRAQKGAINPPAKFSWPFFEIMASAAAFAVWAFSLPSTPLRDLPGFDYSAWNSVIILGGSVTIATVAYVFGRTVDWEKRVTP